MNRPHWWREACTTLANEDAVLASLIARYPDSGLSITQVSSPFNTLFRAIVGQQISIKAADAVWSRLVALGAVDHPKALLQLTSDRLRSAGLSLRKVDYVQDLARHFVEGKLDPTSWAAMSDAELISELTAVRGIGRWTAEMFLIFNMQRPDIWPIDDIGLQKALAQHYLVGARPGLAMMRTLGERWLPWRTAATWYLWRSLDGVEVIY